MSFVKLSKSRIYHEIHGEGEPYDRVNESCGLGETGIRLLIAGGESIGE